MQDKMESDVKLSIPKLISKLHIDHPVLVRGENAPSDYLSLMVEQLKQQLELPEDGNVQLELTLLKSGQVKKMKILASESEKNQHYLEIHLPKMEFPPFTEDWKNVYEQTVIFTFCNEKF